jgi:hypothetical protein
MEKEIGLQIRIGGCSMVKLTGDKLKSLIDTTVMKEAKAVTSERQEREFVSVVEQHITGIGGPINLKFTNKTVSDVIGITKVEGLAPYGKEPYTDVALSVKGSSLKLSMKGVTAPSIMGAGAVGIDRLFPGWLKSLTPIVVNRFLESGFADGEFFANKDKDLRDMFRKSKKMFKKHGIENVSFSGYADGKEYPLDGNEVPPYLGNMSVEHLEDGTIKLVSNVKDPSKARSLPDMFFKIGEKHIRDLFVGTEEMGGPIDYLYKGPMNIKTEWNKETRTLTIKGTGLFDVDGFVSNHPDVYLRVRKRRIDQPFSPNKTHPILGNAIFGTGVISKDSNARIVITNEISRFGEYGGEI